MATESVQLKWQGKAAAKLRKTTADDVWSLLEDFCSIQKWLPSIDTCRKLEGVDGKPGLVRYCAATLPSPTEEGEEVVKWCHEKLIAIDPISKWLSYEVLDNNMGFNSYMSTIKVVPINGEDEPNGCMIQWSFVADPIEDLSYEDFITYLEFSLQGMSEKMEKEFECTLLSDTKI